LLALSVVALLIPGCNFAGLIVNPIVNSDRKVDVDAVYRGLDNQTIAVVVYADGQLLFSNPEADANVCRVVSGRIAAKVPGARVVNPEDMINFMRENEYWNTLLYSELVEKLNVDRIVTIDLVDYNTNEPGNKHVWRGRIAANVGVVAREGTATSSDPDNLAFAQVLSVNFPEDTNIGVVNSDRQTVELGMLASFGDRTAKLFYDHQEEAGH